MSNYGQDFSYLRAISDLFSFVTIILCTVCKVPQIRRLIYVKKAHGISILGLLMELFSYSVMFTYNYRNGYSVLSYLEYPLILVQQLILIHLVVFYKGLISWRIVMMSQSYYVILAAMISGTIPREFIVFLAPFCTPIGVSSKVIQLYEIIRLQNADSISVLTWLISTFTNATRLFTIYLDSADTILLLNSAVNMTLSFSVMTTAYILKKRKLKR